MTIKKPTPMSQQEYHSNVLRQLEARIDHELALHIDLYPNKSIRKIFIAADETWPFSGTHLDILRLRYEEAGWEMEWVDNGSPSAGFEAGYRITFS